MARPYKWRKIERIPTISYFVPAEKYDPMIVENILKLEELEAIRLKDLEGLEQEECARIMEVSRPTFQRILISAREKIADSLINGKSIRIEGGNYTRNICSIKCLNCGNTWAESYENIDIGQKLCPSCGSEEVVCVKNCNDINCGRYRHRHGQKYRNEK